MASVFKRGGKSNRHGSWYIQWVDHNGNRTTKSAKTTDKATAERIAAKHEADAALRREGVIDPTLDAIGMESKRSVESHLSDFEDKFRTGGRSGQYIRETTGYIREFAASADWNNVSAIKADDVTKFVQELLEKNKSARTIQAYLTAMKGFTKWLTQHHKLSRDPLASISKPSPKSDRRRHRRMLLPAEWPHLEKATLQGPVRYGMAANERALLYSTAIETGLRSNELRSLTRGNLFLDSNPPFITCEAGSTKSRKKATQYIQSDLASALKAFITTKMTQTSVFDLPAKTDLARMLREDLDAARKAWIKAAIKDADEYVRREQSDFLSDTNNNGELIVRLPQPEAHLWGLAGPDRGSSQGRSIDHASFDHHVDHGHLRSSLPWPRGRRGGKAWLLADPAPAGAKGNRDRR